MSDPATNDMFTPTRDFCVALCQSLGAVPIDTLERAIEQGERALSIGPILDPTLYVKAGNELAQQVRLLKAVLQLRLHIEGFRVQ